MSCIVRMSFCFFFSSRRRHTRLQGDWSSDVCSSDLPDRRFRRQRRPRNHPRTALIKCHRARSFRAKQADSFFFAFCSCGMSPAQSRSEEHTSELQSPCNLVCRLLLEKKKINNNLLCALVPTVAPRIPTDSECNTPRSRANLCPHAPVQVLCFAVDATLDPPRAHYIVI